MNYKERIENIKKRFLEEIKNHSVEILNDNGIYRTLMCSNNGSCFYKFYITTWDNYLCVSGDMGVWVFSRLNDMFCFFRGKENPDFDYWAEKLEGGTQNNHAIAEYWDRELFIEQFKNYIDEYCDYTCECECEDKCECNNPKREKFLRIAEKEIFPNIERKYDVYDAIFNCEEILNGLFGGYYEHAFGEQYHPRFIWVCFAIVWAIKEYDKIKNEE